MSNIGINIYDYPTVSFELPHLPSINELIDEAGRSKFHRGQLTATLRAEGKAIATDWVNRSHSGPLGRSCVFVGVWRADNRRRDVHNILIKPLLDGFVDAGLWPDDSEKFIPMVIIKYMGVAEKEKVQVDIYDV
jgi:Holliday junction resolvase RusA-like endonuclease